MILTSKKLKAQQHAAEALKKFRENRWSSMASAYLSRRGLITALFTLLFNALLLQFVLPLLPSVVFAGGFGQAIASALMVLGMSAVVGVAMNYIIEASLSFAAKGQEGKSSAIIFGLFFVGAPVVEALKLKVLTAVPGSLAMHDTVGWILATFVFLVSGIIFATVFHQVWPLPTAPAVEDSSEESQD